MEITTYIAVMGIIAIFILLGKKPKKLNDEQLNFPASDFRYTIFSVPLNGKPKTLDIILEGDKIDELGYEIYKSYTADLDKTDILIRENQTGEIWKIVENSDSESMIGVRHPAKGHIGYLQFELMN